MNQFTWTDDKINEMQEKAYQACKRFFAQYIKFWKMYQKEGREFLREVAESYLENYKGACDVYEDVFEEEFYLNDEDRKKILGPIGFGSSAEDESIVVMRE